MNVPTEYADIDERELVVRAQRGDRVAMREIYNRYRERVHHLVFYSLDEPHSVEDTLQTVFLKVFRALPGFRSEAQPSTWIYRIVINECLNQNRRRRADSVPLEAILGSGEELDRAEMADERHSRHEMSRIIRESVMDLPTHLRTAVVLRYVEGLSYDQMAAVLGCAPGTVASRLARALARMEARLRPLKGIL
jgi:RNA polymerase sigma-70 factor, ECF subfamily